MSRFAKVAFIATVAAVTCSAAPVPAGPTVPYKDKAIGKVTAVVPLSTTEVHVGIAGVGVATHGGKFQFVASHVVNVTNGQITNGLLTSITADGSTIQISYTGLTAPPDPSAPNIRHLILGGQFGGGTRRLSGVVGPVQSDVFVNGPPAIGTPFTFFSSGTMTKR